MSDSRYSSSVNLRRFQADGLLLYSQYLIQSLKPAGEELEKMTLRNQYSFSNATNQKKILN